MDLQSFSEKIRLHTTICTVSAETNDTVNCLTTLFGSFFLRLRKSFPKITEPTKHVHYNSILNFVDLSNQMSQNFITFKYDEKICALAGVLTLPHFNLKSRTY